MLFSHLKKGLDFTPEQCHDCISGQKPIYLFSLDVNPSTTWICTVTFITVWCYNRICPSPGKAFM